MNRKLCGVAVALAALLVVLVTAAPAGTVGVAAPVRDTTTFTSYMSVSYGDDTFTNFDLVAKGGADVDWAVDVIFWGNATVSKIYNKLGWIWPGANAYMQVNDGTGPVWAASQGRKNTLCTATHLRLYADADGYLTNLPLGNYVIGTAHIDRNECSRTPTYGWNETAEANVASRAETVWGKSAVQRNATALPDGTPTLGLLGNSVSFSTSNHFWDNNGSPTLIRVP